MATTSTSSMTEISAMLSAAVGSPDGAEEAMWASALRLRCRLQPAGGQGTKVMPPTYAPEQKGNAPLYIHEERLIGDDRHECVLLDGIASQANRIEDAVGARMTAGEITLPTIEVDQGEFGSHTGLEFSHRCFDAWIEDAQIEGQRFGETDLFKRLAGSPSRHDLTALMETFPVGILLGCWASRKKNPQGTTRLARILSSEIVAVDAVHGARPASRIDRHHVSSAIRLVPTTDTSKDRFSLATSKDGKVTKASESPSELGYGNVPPKLAAHGGITMGHALQIATVSMPALRECRFPSDSAESGLRDIAGRMMLGALALRMLALQVEHGYDLRSGCLLVPEEEPTVELVGRLGKPVASWPLISIDTAGLLATAVEFGSKQELDWVGQKIRLTVSEAQLAMLRQSLDQSDVEVAP